MKNLMAAIATKKATTFPISRVTKLSDNIETAVGSVTILSNLYPEAAAMVGTARKKENSAAFLRVSLVVIPPTIVAMERETPGIMAIHWKNPILRDRFQSMVWS